MTAAHCVGSSGDRTNAQPGKLVEIRFGEHDLTKNPDCAADAEECAAPFVSRRPAKILVHESYNGRTTSRGDIALIRLDEMLPLYTGDATVSTITPVCLPWQPKDLRRQLQVGKNLRVMGWGKVT